MSNTLMSTSPYLLCGQREGENASFSASLLYISLSSSLRGEEGGEGKGGVL